jgi:hypothetical protein
LSRAELAKGLVSKRVLVLTVNSSIAVLISLSDHLVNLIISQLLANGCHDVTELGSGDEAVVITIKDLEVTVLA